MHSHLCLHFVYFVSAKEKEEIRFSPHAICLPSHGPNSTMAMSNVYFSYNSSHSESFYSTNQADIPKISLNCKIT